MGPTGKVIAFEPSPRELTRLKLNLVLNQSKNVQIEPMALGSEIGTKEMFICMGKDTGCNSLRPPKVSDPIKSTPIQITTLNAYLQEHPIPKVNFIKLDVEGGELDLLKGADQLLKEHRPLLLCEVYDNRSEPWGYKCVDVYDLLQTYCYHWFNFTNAGKLKSFPRKLEYSENLLAVPEEKIQSLKSYFSIPGEP